MAKADEDISQMFLVPATVCEGGRGTMGAGTLSGWFSTYISYLRERTLLQRYHLHGFNTKTDGRAAPYGCNRRTVVRVVIAGRCQIYRPI